EPLARETSLSLFLRAQHLNSPLIAVVALAFLTVLGVTLPPFQLTSLENRRIEMQMSESRRWRFKGPEMEGAIARWYARVRGSQSQLDMYRKQASELTTGLADGARVLEVAPGPGFLAIEMARSGRLHITALDISRTFVEIA